MTRKIKLGWGSMPDKRTKPFKRRKVIRTDGDYKFIDVRFTLQPSIISRGKSPVKSDDYPYGLDEHSPEFFREVKHRQDMYNHKNLVRRIQEDVHLEKHRNIAAAVAVAAINAALIGIALLKMS